MRSKFLLVALVAIITCTSGNNANAQEAMIGEVKMFAGNFAPRGWALCDGQLLSISSNTALFSILGTTYGGDGRTTFALPDMRGRVVMHPGNGPGLTPHRLGEKGGFEKTTITTNNLPAHSHNMPIVDVAALHTEEHREGEHTEHHATTSKVSHSVLAEPNNPNGVLQTKTTGGAQPINNVQPYVSVNYIIAVSGNFPSRN
jgi:microcystin-dependent protein